MHALEEEWQRGACIGKEDPYSYFAPLFVRSGLFVWFLTSVCLATPSLTDGRTGTAANAVPCRQGAT